MRCAVCAISSATWPKARSERQKECEEQMQKERTLGSDLSALCGSGKFADLTLKVQLALCSYPSAHPAASVDRTSAERVVAHCGGSGIWGLLLHRPSCSAPRPVRIELHVAAHGLALRCDYLKQLIDANPTAPVPRISFVLAGC